MDAGERIAHRSVVRDGCDADGQLRRVLRAAHLDLLDRLPLHRRRVH
jgi:hypothetical protein